MHTQVLAENIPDMAHFTDLLFLARDDAGTGTSSPTARGMIEATAANTARDVPIWEHEIYVERAPLVPEDGLIRELRKWARQFSPGDDARARG
jgi:hypothetical protein